MTSWSLFVMAKLPDNLQRLQEVTAPGKKQIQHINLGPAVTSLLGVVSVRHFEIDLKRLTREGTETLLSLMLKYSLR